MEILVGDREAGVDHAQGFKDAATEGLGERLPVDHLDNPAEDVSSHRVGPSGAGLMTEG